MKKTIGILAHVDAGKTTFAEQVLYHTNTIKVRGRVDHKDAFLDSDKIEKERGITIFSGQAVMSYKGSDYYLIDTPGHVDFSPEMERAIQVMDIAIIIISAVEGVEGHTETVWQLLRKNHVPTFFFINKTDRVGADIEGTLKEIRQDLTGDVCDITESLNDDGMKEELIEFIAERDEELFDMYMDGKFDESLWLRRMAGMIKQNKIFPCAWGSALQDRGIKDFFDKVDTLTYTDYSNDGPFAGKVYKIRHDESGTRVTYMKALSGSLRVRDEIRCGSGEDGICEKITGIRIYNGDRFKIVDKVEAGDIFAVTGLSMASAGDGAGALKEKAVYEMVPALKSKVIFDPTLDVKDVLNYFRMLDAEDPSLNVVWEEKLQEIDIHVMGVIQLEVLQETAKDRFGIRVEFGTPEILYKETICSSADGWGHFEPLKHYAEVHIKIEPGERGSGIVFENACSNDYLSPGYQNLIRHHIFEREHHGILTGSTLTDIKVTLVRGKSHIKHTCGGDFREATYRALRQGLEKAENILLEPYYDFRIKVDSEYIGRVLSDVQAAHGTFETPETMGNKTILEGKVPVSTFMNYAVTLSSFTHGTGSLNLAFGGYCRCHNEEEVIVRKGYNKDADPEYTSSSIFCSKGQSYVVPYTEAEGLMHCL